MARSPSRLLVLLALAAPVAFAQPADVNGRNVQFVEFGAEDGQRLGYFAAGINNQWFESPRDPNGGRFSFVETHRDEWSVYLHDASRVVDIQLDLYRREVLYRDGSTDGYVTLYRIYDVSDERITASSPDPSPWTGQIPTTQQQALRAYLEGASGFAVPGPERSPVTEGYDVGVSPFYLTGDFNQDGRTDFAVALVGPVQPGAEYPTLRVVILNGAPGGAYRVAYEEDTWIDSRAFYMGADVGQVYYGMAETDGTTMLEPDGDGYIAVYPEDAP